ncbi:MAG: PQQ-binding-like beta-propeller repeat protein [Betaproteobacteria bacterium]|nr:PQQ-binding-like beta-propeller repeat protein [Betaproteobacteria bacterium]
MQNISSSFQMPVKRPIAQLLTLLVLSCFGGSSWAQATTAEQAQSGNPVAAEFPDQYFPQNLPDPAIAVLFPQTWTTYAANPERNAVFALSGNAPESLRRGVSWKFAGAGAIPLDGPPLDNNFSTTAYNIGMPVGASVVNGIVYEGSDNGYTYALNALNGKLIWAHYGWNMTMSNPLVVDGRVFVSTGNAYFNYANTMLYVKGKRPTRGPGLNTMYALDAKTGKKLWAYHFPGEAMPTAVYDQGFLYIGTGDGHVYKLDAVTGKLALTTDLVSFVSMSSPVLAGDNLFLGGTNPNYFYAVNKKTGSIAWKITLPKLVATGIGDCTPAYADGLVIQEATVETGDKEKPVANVLLAMDASSGKIVWQKQLESGPVPPAMKTATPMIAGDKVLEGSPVTGNYYAFDLKTGRELWKVRLGAQIRAGAAVADGVAYVPYKSGDIAAIRVADGTLLGQKHLGGAFGPSSPVIVGGTLYVSNIYGWVIAIPLSDIAH